MKTIYILQTSEQDPSTGGLEFTCLNKAERAYFEAHFRCPTVGGFASLIEVYATDKTAVGYSQKTIRQYQTGIYNNR